MGDREDVARFTALWISDSEKRAHRINELIFHSSLVLLPLPEAEFSEPPKRRLEDWEIALDVPEPEQERVRREQEE
jgi:hypothetical protein